MNDPIFDLLHAELDAAEARMDAAGVPKPTKRVRCDLCKGTGFWDAHKCRPCNGRGFVNTDAEDGA